MINLLKFTDSGSFVEWNTMETDRLNEKSDTDDNLVNQLREVEQYPDPMLRSRIIGAANRIEQLTSGPGGIMEMKQTIANLEEKLEKIASHHIPGVIPDGYTMTEWILKNYTMLKDIARG